MGSAGLRATLGVALSALAGALICAGATTTHAQAGAATRALGYLESQQSAKDGSLAGGFGVNDLYVIGAAAGGFDPSLLRNGGPSVLDYLSANAAAACPAAGGSSASAGGCGELIQTVVAAAMNPKAFGGLDLLSRLSAYYDAGTGRYGDGQAFTQALAIQGLVAAAQPVPAAALTFLRNAEDSDGGWDFQDIKDDPHSSTNFDTSDSNSTAMVLMALDAAGDHSRDHAGLHWVHTLQNTDGGFSFQGGGSDPDSTALVLQAILATGGSPTSASWTVGGHTPTSDLIAIQDTGGGYTFPGNPAPDPFTTSQVPPALEGAVYPASTGNRLFTPGTALSGQPQPAPSPTPSSPPAGLVTPLAGENGQATVAVPSTGGSAETQAPVGSGGAPSSIIFVLAALAAAALVAGSGLYLARR